jgi:hypothetical protein
MRFEFRKSARQAFIFSSVGKSEIFDRFLEEFRAVAIHFLPCGYGDWSNVMTR